jgi:hypothetical protein
MAAQNHSNKTATGFSPVMLDTIISLIDRQIEQGEMLIRNRPVTRDVFENWEKSTCKILQKSASIDPVAVDRFLGCGAYGDLRTKASESFWETHRAMSIYDKIRILDYHQELLKREKKWTKSAVEN